MQVRRVLTTANFADVTALAAMSAVAMVELVTVCVEPAKCAMPAPGDDATTQVVQVMVPVLVIGPPPIGDVVAMLVTVPPPNAVEQFWNDPPFWEIWQVPAVETMAISPDAERAGDVDATSRRA
jgi:hypothetical protein